MGTRPAPADEARLVEAARAVRGHAHAPYSRYQVGAALLTRVGHVYAGCNVENATYGATLCAERSAVAAMVAAGDREPIACAVVTAGPRPRAPRGVCRPARGGGGGAPGRPPRADRLRRGDRRAAARCAVRYLPPGADRVHPRGAQVQGRHGSRRQSRQDHREEDRLARRTLAQRLPPRTLTSDARARRRARRCAPADAIVRP